MAALPSVPASSISFCASRYCSRLPRDRGDRSALSIYAANLGCSLLVQPLAISLVVRVDTGRDDRGKLVGATPAVFLERHARPRPGGTDTFRGSRKSRPCFPMADAAAVFCLPCGNVRVVHASSRRTFAGIWTGWSLQLLFLSLAPTRRKRSGFVRRSPRGAIERPGNLGWPLCCAPRHPHGFGSSVLSTHRKAERCRRSVASSAKISRDDHLRISPAGCSGLAQQHREIRLNQTIALCSLQRFAVEMSSSVFPSTQHPTRLTA